LATSRANSSGLEVILACRQNPTMMAHNCFGVKLGDKQGQQQYMPRTLLAWN